MEQVQRRFKQLGYPWVGHWRTLSYNHLSWPKSTAYWKHNKTSTYQKPMNLYLYIPPNSSQPPSCLKGLISGELCCYFLQNNPTDFQNILTKFIGKLGNRGHTIEDLTPLCFKPGSSNATTCNDGGPIHTFPTLDLPSKPSGLQWQDLKKNLQ
jgi:hypothetical protein